MFYIDIMEYAKTFQRFHYDDKNNVIEMCKRALESLDDGLNVGFRVGWTNERPKGR